MPFPRSGTFRSGTFHSGSFRPGSFPPTPFRPGTFCPGIFCPGIFCPGAFCPGAFRPGTFPPRLFVLLRPFCPACLPPPRGDVRQREKALVRVGDRSVVMGREDARSEEERGPLGEGRPARQRREGRLVGRKRNLVRCGAARSEGRTPGCRRSPAGCISGGKAACGAGLEDQMIQIG